MKANENFKIEVQSGEDYRMEKNNTKISIQADGVYVWTNWGNENIELGKTTQHPSWNKLSREEQELYGICRFADTYRKGNLSTPSICMYEIIK